MMVETLYQRCCLQIRAENDAKRGQESKKERVKPDDQKRGTKSPKVNEKSRQGAGPKPREKEGMQRRRATKGQSRKQARQ